MSPQNQKSRQGRGKSRDRVGKVRLDYIPAVQLSVQNSAKLSHRLTPPLIFNMFNKGSPYSEKLMVSVGQSISNFFKV